MSDGWSRVAPVTDSTHLRPQRCAMALDVQTCVVFTVIAFLVLVNVLLMFILGTR